MPCTLKKIGEPVLQTIRTYEPHRDHLASVQNKAGPSTRSSYTYVVNDLGQRTDLAAAFDLGDGIVANPGGTAWLYDDLGPVISADAPDLSVVFTDRTYDFDAIGNRKQSATGTWSLDPNNKPHFSPGVATSVFGVVTTNGTPSEPGANPLNQYKAITTGATTLQPVFDGDGNMTSGPLPVAPATNAPLAWDAENRLISTTAGATTYACDAQSRRIAKTTTEGGTILYLYDGWNCIAEYTSASTAAPALSRIHTWGLDLSGTLQGAGEVGGLLVVNIAGTRYYPSFDGNGNVSEYLAANGSTAAHFEYDPFGNTVVNTDASNLFPYRFSTKPLDSESGLYYYGYRYYDPLTGRWPSRDPIGERGGLNPYAFVNNCSPCNVDYLGQKPCPANGLPYEPTKWNDPTSKSNFNCYDYACNRRRGYFTQPGEPSGNKETKITCEALLRAAIKDNEAQKPSSEGCCPKGYHLIQLVLTAERAGSYHWLRQDNDGTWSHKDGEGDCTNKDASGKEISDPSSADLDFSKNKNIRGLNYKIICPHKVCVKN